MTTPERSWRVLVPRAAPAVLAAMVIAYGTLLRFDAMVGMYGPIKAPAWLATVATAESQVHSVLVPHAWVFHKVDRPYVGGDPINYLTYARAMRNFYQPHVREPVFLALTRAWLGLTGGQDIGISLASITGCLVFMWGTYLFGSAVATRWVGLAAAAVLAIEGEAVAWAPEGWRDSTCAAGLAVAMWTIVRLHQRRTHGWAIAAGVAGGVACLTRLTAFTWFVPALAGVIWIAPRGERRQVAQRVGLAALVAAVVVLPYLVNCARTFGDPLYAINYHARYYRAAAGEPPNDRQSAAGFAWEQVQHRPIAAIDTAFRGVVVYPFANKWRGVDRWWPGLGLVLSWLSAVGLLVWLWQPMGRVLLAALAGSLAPYMLTWRLGGGGEWRFTMHAYAFYLVAACAVVPGAWRAMRSPSSRWSAFDAAHRRRTAWVLATSSAVVVAGWLGLWRSPAWVAAETLRAGEPATVGSDQNDGVFFGAGWSGRVGTEPVVARFAVARSATVWVPLPERRPYRLVVRMDPVPPEVIAPGRVEVFLGARRLAELPLTWNPARVGSYVVDVPAEVAGGGLTALEFRSDGPLVPLGDVARRYEGLSASRPVGFRLWLVRVSPAGGG